MFAAASLTDVLPELDPDAAFQFAASDTLATQLTEGAPADVYVAANSELPQALHVQNIVDEPVTFATNRVVLIVPSSSTISSIKELAADRSADIVVAQAGVPLGDYTVKVLESIDYLSLAVRARSQEADARAVTTKVAMNEADAGFVYATDARAAGDKVRSIELPRTDENVATYDVAIVRDSKRAAAARTFVDTLTAKQGRDALTAAGFGVPPLDENAS